MSGKIPTLSEVLEAAIDGKLDDVRVSLPGRIESYNAERRRATVQVLIMDRHVDGDGVQRAVSIAQLTDVPVAHLGMGTVRIKFPIRSGDPCWLSFASSSIAKLKAAARAVVVDPGDDRHHHLTDAIAEPWSYLAEDEDEAMIEFTLDGKIRAGGDEPLMTRAEFLSHGHASAAPGPVSPPILHPSPLPGVDPTFPGSSRLRG